MNRYEDFFFSKLMVQTDIVNCYFYMPSNACFTYFINEIALSIKNSENENIRKAYIIELCKNFYLFLDKDKVLKQIDSLQFVDLYLVIKSIAEGNCKYSNQIVIDKLFSLKRKFSDKCLCYVINEIKKYSTDNDFDEDYLSYLTDLFLNELLARGIDIRFIHNVAQWYIDKTHFKDFSSFLDFFFEENILTDIYLPIINYSDENIKTIKNLKQDVIENENKYFLHVYQNDSNDYFSIIKLNMTRIQSMFNMLKFYTGSKIDFDLNGKILINVENKNLLQGSISLEINFEDIIQYRGLAPSGKYFETTISNLDVISDYDTILYHKILNIIGYAEKDNDIINSSSYVDAWIALESLYSLPKTKSGFESVSSTLPQLISSKIIFQRLTFLLKNSFKKNKLDIEYFIKKACNDEKIKMTCTNPFYCYELNKMYKCCSNISKLAEYYKKMENQLLLDLLRIYMLRNEYVHESKLSAFSSLHFYKLKNILTISIDLFFSMINQKVRIIDKIDDLSFSVFSSLIKKNEDRELIFKIFNTNIKYNSNSERISILELESKLNLSDLILNIILNNNKLTTKFVRYERD
ncbi:MAG: hypothetical protein MJ232_03025 [archaeon]|nr:hypothetical protein [archaeon]